MSTGLTHIEENSIHPSVLENYQGSFSIGPLTIEYSLDISVPSFSFTVTLAGIVIGQGTLNPSQPSLTIGGGAMGFKAEVTLTADFAKEEVDYKIELCAPIAGCKDYEGQLFSW